MKTLGRSFAIAFSMYSRIPMPQVAWNRQSMRYALCFLPLIGIANGVLLWLLFYASQVWNLEKVLIASLAVILPIAVTGGIHLDGFCDTVDALSSHQPAEKKLEILKDPHIGAFALIGCSCYLIVQFGLWTQLNFNLQNVLILSLGFVLSRAMSGFAVVTFPCAKTSGLAAAFSDSAQKIIVRISMICYAVFASILMILTEPIVGSVAVFAAAAVDIWYWKMSRKEFGGITGDLAGWFLQMCELTMLLAVATFGGTV